MGVEPHSIQLTLTSWPQLASQSFWSSSDCLISISMNLTKFCIMTLNARAHISFDKLFQRVNISVFLEVDRVESRVESRPIRISLPLYALRQAEPRPDSEGLDAIFIEGDRGYGYYLLLCYKIIVTTCTGTLLVLYLYIRRWKSLNFQCYVCTYMVALAALVCQSLLLGR